MLRASGTILSRAIARLIRDDAMMLALADEMVASSPAKMIAPAPIGPASVRAACVSGSRTSPMVDCENMPPMTSRITT